MMPTDEERREVARSLRALAKCNEGSLRTDRMNAVLTQAKTITGTGGLPSAAHVLTRYADLIEPAPERTCAVEHWGGGVFYLSCGHDSTEHVKPDYCPTCGARVVDE